MTPQRRAELRRLVDAARREILTGSPEGDPTLYGQCLYCGHRFQLYARGQRQSYCKTSHKENDKRRRNRLLAIARAAQRQPAVESCGEPLTGVESIPLPSRALIAA